MFSSRLFADSLCHLTYTARNHAIPLSLDTSLTHSGGDLPFSAGYRALPQLGAAPGSGGSPAPTAGPHCRPLDRFACLFSVQAAQRPGGRACRDGLSLSHPVLVGCSAVWAFFQDQYLPSGHRPQRSGKRPLLPPQCCSLLTQPSPARRFRDLGRGPSSAYPLPAPGCCPVARRAVPSERAIASEGPLAPPGRTRRETPRRSSTLPEPPTRPPARPGPAAGPRPAHRSRRLSEPRVHQRQQLPLPPAPG